jgi:phospholipid/cholesterol/gamma-HCH transport system substrate-binding protein
MTFLVVLVTLLVLSFNLDKLPFTSGQGYSAAFAQADGLRPGDFVMVGGVNVGKVKSVDLEGTHVRVDFTITSGGVHLGTDSTASIQIATLLGNKYLALEPKGPGTWPSDRELPLERTATPYDVSPALQDLGRTVGQIDTHRLAGALDTLATTFRNSPAATRSMLAGLSRLSRSIASRNQQLGELLQRADAVTGVLAGRRQDFVQIFGAGDQLLQMLDQRRRAINALLHNTVDLSDQLSGLVHDNSATLGPALRHVRGVLDLLNAHQDELNQIVQELYVFVRGEVDATGSGPWFDGSAINATNPFQVSGSTTPTGHPRTLGDLLGLSQADRALRSAAR